MEIFNLGNIVVNTYLIRVNEKLVLVDTGYPGGHNRFFKKLAELDIRPADIDFVLLTHAHDDHAGFLNEVLAATDATLILHKKAIRRLGLGHNEWIGGCSGILAYVFVKGMSLFGKGRHEFPRIEIPQTAVICDDDSRYFMDQGIPVKIVNLPGHTEDHIGLIIEDKVIFCGDAAMNGFPSTKRRIIWIEDLESYKRSWDRMLEEDFELVYPSHGKSFPREDLLKYRASLEKVRIIPLKPHH